MRLIEKSAAILILASLALLPACSAPEAPAPEPSAPQAEDGQTDDGLTEETSEEPADAGDLLGACETFNALSERLRTADESVDDVFIDIYEEADAAAAVAPEDLRGALAALSIVALDRDGGEVPQEDRDLMLEQVLHITPICAEQGVEIVL